jgi:hypothetical protein
MIRPNHHVLIDHAAGDDDPIAQRFAHTLAREIVVRFAD